MAKTKKNVCFKVNEPHVVHETIDGETILLNLSTGNYFSIEWPGTLVWDLLCSSNNPAAVKQALTQRNPANSEIIDRTADAFFDSLLNEKLVIADEENSPGELSVDDKTTAELEKAVNHLDKLVLNTYSDMRDLLLLDPIHEVDAKGWPEPRKEE